MIKCKKILAIIPARGGSKGIPRKNIIEVDGKPLIQYTIDAAKSSKYIDEIFVSTDDREIATVVEKLGICVPRLRPKSLAQDFSKTIDVILDTIEYLSRLDKIFDYVVLLQPTQPLRQAFHIDEAIEQIIEKGASSLVSVNLVEEHPILMRTIDEKGSLISILNVNSTVRRQDFQPYYFVNGAIYINKIDKELNSYTSLNDNKMAYIMDKKFSIDIDEKNDLDQLVWRIRQ